MERDSSNPSMAALQESDYGDGRDYTYGSPHLAHDGLRSTIEADLKVLVGETKARKGRCNVLEVGAGHGTFTEVLADAGARVTVTEMSAPSARVLETRFAGTTSVSVVYDPEGDRSKVLAGKDCDLIVMISVVHHIPDYVAVISELVGAMEPGGGFYCAQDPTWYPARSKASHAIDRGAYLLWRLGQGNLKRGLQTRVRRLRGVYDDTTPSDMVEYHVVRDGVDQCALETMLKERFEDVDVWLYWSTQSAMLQRIGERMGWHSTFGLIATGRRI